MIQDEPGIQRQYKLTELLNEVFGEDAWDDSALNTAGRVLRYWYTYAAEDMNFEATTFPVAAQQMITVTHIEFSSICAHHLLPFYGIAHVAYIPHKLAIGLSKIPRAVNYFSHRPQVQERMTNEIADWMQDTLEPKGSAVVTRATHTCMSCRGIMARNARMIVSELRGIFLTSGGPRDEFYAMIQGD